MWKEYKETFENVHASQRLKTEVLNMKREENTAKKRWAPAAVLAAAILLVVLAGTAVAREYYWGGVNVAPIENSYENGYCLRGDIQNIPPQRLSQEVLDRAAQAGSGNEKWTFGSWSEAEDFLGLEIADNSVLDHLAQSEWTPSHAHDAALEEAHRCTVKMNYSAGLPDVIDVYASYFDEETPFFCIASATMLVSGSGGNRPYNMSNMISRDAVVEEYVTPNGLDVTVVDSYHTISCMDGSSFEEQTYTAYFILHDALFSVETSVITDDDPLDMLKQILDAYE